MSLVPRQAHRRSGFTLVELMVALAVLTIMLIGLASAMGLVSRLWVSGASETDNFTKAHVVLNLLDRDIQMMVLRRDLAAFVDQNGNAVDSNGNPICAFYTNIAGNPGTDSRTLSLVQYLLSTPTTTPTLQRLNSGMNFSTSSGSTPTVGTTGSLSPPANATLQTDTVFTGIIRFQIQFVDGTGTFLIPPYIPTSSTGTVAGPFTYDFIKPADTSNPRAVVVSMLVLSNSAYTIATQSGSTTIAKLLADFPVGTSASLPTGMISTTINGNTYPAETYAQYWDSILNPATGTLDPTLPGPVRSGIQVFERHISLPVTTPSS
jgi:prepilin-type N-terminal cleavage/methylation domain-containing protein